MMRIGVGVIGTGYWGKNLLRNLKDLEVLTAFCDSDDTVRAAFSADFPDARPYADISELLVDSAVSAVAIATPAITHGPLVRAALEAGKHVFVEKPLCLDLAEAEELGALSDEKSLILMVGHLLLYHPAFLAVHDSVANGDIGRLRYIYSNRASFGKIRREENALWSFAPHDISMMLALTGRMPVRVNCQGEAWLSPDVADLTLSHFDFADGVQAHIFVSWLNPFKDHKLVVIGEDGMIVFNDTLQGDTKVLRYDHAAGWKGDIPVLAKADAVPIPYGSEEPLKEEMQHFLNCCAMGERPRSDTREGTNVLRVLDMCQRSLASRMPVGGDMK